ncbi:hypothetical protein [Seonamhaeicola marinus]|uniref:hypothetical protein n=1 Tax=Seonamhaeicola marinus TaxID=1912246 RepID=UPI001652A5BE|nr:hypothetical protein [Seonamhaeicola marinus]
MIFNEFWNRCLNLNQISVVQVNANRNLADKSLWWTTIPAGNTVLNPNLNGTD